jgi:hypothetical protein
VFDDCDEVADYALTTRWSDGQVWREVNATSDLTNAAGELVPVQATSPLYLQSVAVLARKLSGNTSVLCASA